MQKEFLAILAVIATVLRSAIFFITFWSAFSWHPAIRGDPVPPEF